MYSLMFDEIRVIVVDSSEMLGIPAQSRRWFHFTSAPIWPSGSLDVTHSKVGRGPLKLGRFIVPAAELQVHQKGDVA
jgi:hypothetical protein